MRYLSVLVFCAFAGCSNSAGTNTRNAGQSYLYQPGGIFYVEPGTFTGLWIAANKTTVADLWVNDTNPCTAVISESDSLLAGTITNDSTKEVLNLKGYHTSCIDCITPQPHIYNVTSFSSMGDTDIPSMGFYPSGDTMFYQGLRKVPEGGLPVTAILIGGIRKK